MPTARIVRTPGHAFYDKLNALLAEWRFDQRVEHLCRRYYTGPLGQPSMPPGVYFRCLLVGYFEGIDSERGIAWRVADSLSLRQFLGYGLDEPTPDHSTISRTRRLYWLSTHQAVFRWVLKRLADAGLVRGQTIAIDATTLEANAALRAIVRRDTGEGYEDYLRGLATQAGIAQPTQAELARFDRKRKKKGSNGEWQHPHDPDARITKMKDGRTHFAHKAEHAVDLDTGAVLAITVHPADAGDTTTGPATLDAAMGMTKGVGLDPVVEAVLDRGYHSDGVLAELETRQVRGYVAEPQRKRRRWRGKGKPARAAQQRLYANRRRLRGRRNKQLQARRAEFSERAHAHLYETGGLRRVHLRGRENIAKRLLIHGAAFNLGLVMRARFGIGTPRSLQGHGAAVSHLVHRLRIRVTSFLHSLGFPCRRFRSPLPPTTSPFPHSPPRLISSISTTGC